MDKRLKIQMGADGLPNDDVSHYTASAEQLRSYVQAAEDLYRFKAPALFNQADPHSYLLVGLMDGTGKDATQDRRYVPKLVFSENRSNKELQ